MSKVRTSVCSSKYYQNNIRYQANAPLSSDYLAFPLICYGKISQNLHNL